MNAKSKSATKTTNQRENDHIFYLAGLIDNISDALISTDMEFNILEWNATAESIYGWGAAEVIGHPINQFVQSEYANTNRENVIQTVLEHGSWKGEVTQNRKDGSRFPVMASVSQVQDKAGNPIGFITINRDISDRKQMEEALRWNADKFSILFNGAPYAAQLAKLPDGLIVEVNAAFENLIGYSRAEAIGKSSVELNIYPDPEIRTRTVAEFKARGFVHNMETTLRAKSGDLRTVLINSDLVEIAGEKYILTTAQDITERKQAEQQIVQMKRLYATLSQVNQTIVRVKDRAELYQSICDVAVRFGEFALAWVGLLDEASGGVQPVAAHGLDVQRWPFPIVNLHQGDMKAGLIATALRTSKVVTSEDVQTDPRVKDLSNQFQKYEYHSSAAVPFRLRGKTIGVVSLASGQAGLFKAEEEVRLLEEMGLDISFALDTMKTEAEHKQAELLLRQSEQKYSIIFDKSPYAIALNKTPENTIVGANDAFLELFEFTRTEVLGKTSVELGIADAESRAKIGAEFQAHGKLHDFEVTRTNKAGRRLNLALNLDRVTIGEQTYILTTIRDITERKRSEEKIQRQLDHLNSLRTIDTAISSSFDIHLTLDIVLQQVLSQLSVDAAAILLINPQLQTIEYAASLGFLSNAIQNAKLNLGEGYAGRTVLERKTVHVPSLMEAGGELAKALQGANENFVDYYGAPLVSKDGIKGVLEIYHRSPLQPDPDWLNFLETLAGQAAIAIDSAQLFENLQRANAELEQRVAQRTAELNQTNIELEHANRAKDEFLATMSHELRTPLNSILGLSETLLEQKRDPLSAHQQRSLQIIAASGQHLLELINDILDLSKIEAGKFEHHPQMISVDDLCRSSLTFVKEQATRKSITLTYQQDTTISKIYADPRRLKQILVNLLTNAVKFTPDNGQILLQVHGDVEQGRIQFSVIDTGIGIAPEDIKKLFQPFVQLDSRLTREYEGTGLGLALVQKLTDLQGGSVDVESGVGKGSRFTINLPLGQAMSDQPPVHASGSEQAKKGSTATSSPAERAVILLAEDNAANILTIGDYLESHGYQVVVAHDGLEAIEKAEALQPNIILMDIQMPVLNGLDTISRLRADPRFASTPIIALTALAMPGDRERCLEAGANEYITKPASLKGLIKSVNKLLDKEE